VKHFFNKDNFKRAERIVQRMSWVKKEVNTPEDLNSKTAKIYTGK